MCLSVPQTAVAATRINTSPRPGRGTGQSRTSVPSGPSRGFDLTTAIIVLSSQLAALSSQEKAATRAPESCELRAASFHSMLSRDIAYEFGQRPDERVCIAFVHVLVQCVLGDVQAFARGAGAEDLVRHRAGHDFVR